MKTFQTLSSTLLSTNSFWLYSYCEGFLKFLAEQDYAKKTLRGFRYALSRLCKEAEKRHLKPDMLDKNVLRELARTNSFCASSYMEGQLILMARRFADYLIRCGVIEPAVKTASAAGSAEHWHLELEYWLKHHRGISDSSLPRYRRVFQRLIVFSCADAGESLDFSVLTPEVLFSFLNEHSGKSGWRLGYVRNILRFLHVRGSIAHDLSDAVPKTAGTQSDRRKRHFEPQAVQELLEAARGDSPRDRRDYAMLLIMARLGLRAQEVISIRIDDIDWAVGRMMIRGKGFQFDYMPVPVDVGEAIVDWLRHGRRGDSRCLFTSLYAPHASFKSSTILNHALRRALRQAKLKPPRGEVRTDALRHGLAMNLLNQGSSLREIGEVLRHRALRSTRTYVHYDIEALRSLARAWPIRGVCNDPAHRTRGAISLSTRPIWNRTVRKAGPGIAQTG